MKPVGIQQVVDGGIHFIRMQPLTVRDEVVQTLWIEEGDDFEESISDSILATIKNYISLGVIIPVNKEINPAN